MIRENSFVSLHDCFSHYIHINVVFGLISPPHRKKIGEFYEKLSHVYFSFSKQTTSCEKLTVCRAESSGG